MRFLVELLATLDITPAADIPAAEAQLASRRLACLPLDALAPGLILAQAFGRFVQNIPAPLGIGKVTLDDGSQVSGFLCEPYALEGAREITELGGWRAYIAELNAKNV